MKRKDKLAFVSEQLASFAKLATTNTDAIGWIALKLSCSRAQAERLIDAAFEAHRTADPHCTCNDCIAHYSAESIAASDAADFAADEAGWRAEGGTAPLARPEHTHAFALVRPKGTIERCVCGAWRHSKYNTNPRIVNVPVDATDTEAAQLAPADDTYEADPIRDALRLIIAAYRLAPKSTPANLRRAVQDAIKVLADLHEGTH